MRNQKLLNVVLVAAFLSFLTTVLIWMINNPTTVDHAIKRFGAHPW